MIERILSIVFAIMGVTMIYISLENIIGYVGYVWLIGLILGVQLLVESFRSVMR